MVQLMFLFLNHRDAFMRVFTAIIIVAIFVWGGKSSSAQCCTAGNPVDASFSGGGSKGVLNFSTSFKTSYSSDYYMGNEYIDSNYMDYSYFNFQNFTASYGITNELNLRANIGYFYSKAYRINRNGSPERSANGLGDLGLNASYNISKLIKNKLIILPSVGVILPVGVFDYVDNNVVLAIDAQPSSGALKYNAGVFLSKDFLKTKLNVFSFNLFEYSNTIESERTPSYKYGNLYVNTLGASYAINKWFLPEIQFRSEYRQRAINQENIIDYTGGHNVFASIKGTGKIGDLSGNITIDMPVYKNVNGWQLTNKYIVNVGVAYRLNFNKISHSTNAIEVPADIDLKTIDVKVRGICAMCKVRIESVALNVKNIRFAQYDLINQTLSIQYKKELNINRLFESLSSAGHDNEFMKASNEAYENLHECCKYERN